MRRRSLQWGWVAVVAAWGLGAAGGSSAQEQPKVQIPQPGVPEVMTMEGKYVRAAYNNEGYVIIGYKLANLSVGEEWMLLEAGFALRDGVDDYDMKREAISLELPGGQTIPLATNTEYRSAQLAALQAREKVQRDSINYFPSNAHQACRVGFFAELDQRASAWDEFEINDQRACVGRLFFKVPGGVAYGQHWLNVKFAKSLIRVPFRILTEDEAKFLEKNYKDIEKQVEEAFRPPKK